jgi:ubiquinone/menaquinone biosynthesis C-methylase UbiE
VNEPGFYLMEGPLEGERLERKTNAALVEKQLRWAGLRAGMRALEVGCGTGAVTRVMAQLAAPAGAVGVDQSTDRLEVGRALAAEAGIALELRQGDALRLPLPDASFDFAFSRFLFEYLPDPTAALRELVRVTRSGGTVSVADLEGQIESFEPLSPRLRADLAELLRLLGETGFDPHVGRKLYPWFHAAGLRDLRVDVSPYQVYAGGIPAGERPNWETKIRTTADVLARRTGERARCERVRDELLDVTRRPDLFYCCTIVIVSGRVP